jgi:Arc/MetJ family transcription regulator
MARIDIALDAELVVEVMVLAGVNTPQDAVEAVLRDYIARGHRTEERTELTDRALHAADLTPPQPES